MPITTQPSDPKLLNSCVYFMQTAHWNPMYLYTKHGKLFISFPLPLQSLSGVKRSHRTWAAGHLYHPDLKNSWPARSDSPLHANRSPLS